MPARRVTKRDPHNALSGCLPALRAVDGTASHKGPAPGFSAAWRKAARTSAAFREAQRDERDRGCFDPAVARAKKGGVRTLGQFISYDAMVMHGPGTGDLCFGGIRARARRHAATPADGGNETTYLNAFLDARVRAMQQEEAHSDVTRVETAQRVFLKQGNLDLDTPLKWKVYRGSYTIG